MTMNKLQRAVTLCLLGAALERNPQLAEHLNRQHHRDGRAPANALPNTRFPARSTPRPGRGVRSGHGRNLAYVDAAAVLPVRPLVRQR